MKTKINKHFSIVTIITLLLIAAGCSGMTTPKVKTSDNSTYTLRGSISVGTDASRSATSSMPELSSDVSFAIKAVQGETTIDGEITDGIAANNGSSQVTKSYSITLTSGGEWTITATATVNGTVVGTGSKTIILNDETNLDEALKNDIFIKCPAQMDSSKKGSIKLKIVNQSSDAVKITWKWLDDAFNGSEALQDSTQTVQTRSYTEFNFSAINSGSYKIQLLFNDSNDKLIYSCYETINVFVNYTTDTWYGESPYVNEQNEFVFTDEIANSFAQVETFEAGQPLYALWSTSDCEPDTINGGQPVYNEVGMQLFTSIEEGMKITNPLPLQSGIGTNFCMDGTTIYAPPYRYVQSYAGYCKDESFDLAEAVYTHINSYYEISFPSTSNCVLLDGFLYFIYSIEQYNVYWYYIGRYDIQSKTLIVTNTSIAKINPSNSQFAPAYTIAVTHDDSTGNAGVIYYSGNYDGEGTTRDTIELHHFYVGPSEPEDPNSKTCLMLYNIIGNPAPTDDLKPVIIYLDDYAQFTAELYQTRLKITDMKIVGNYLYALAWAPGAPNNQDSAEYYTKKVEGEEETFVKFYDNWQSNGGLLKFDISPSATTFAPQDWSTGKASETNGKLLGFYALPKTQYDDVAEEDVNIQYYYDDAGTNAAPCGNCTVADSQGEEHTVQYIFPVQPPLVSGKANPNYFYGPRKILSVENNKLIIADDGGFIRYDGLNAEKIPMISSIPVNRIVTVDLGTESITDAVDVGVTFSAAYEYQIYEIPVY